MRFRELGIKNLFFFLFLLILHGIFAAGNDIHHAACSIPCLPKCPCEPKPCCPRTPAFGYDVPCDYAYVYGAGPKIRSCYYGGNAYVGASFLWWTARKEGLAFAGNGVTFDSLESAGFGFYRHPDWEWKPGFKISAGRTWRHDDWDVAAAYTWIDFSGKKEKVFDPNTILENNILVPTWYVGGVLSVDDVFDTQLSKARTTWEFLFQSMDFEIGHNHFASQMLAVRPFSGLKVSWQDEAYRLRYFILESETENLQIKRMRQDQDYWGVGIRSGLDLHFFFSRNWSFAGRLALTPMMSHFEITREDRISGAAASDPFLTTYHVSDDFFTLIGVMELFLGLQFDVWLKKEHRYHFQFQAGWEEQLWWNHNQYVKRIEVSSHGDLMMHGLTLQARFDF